MIRKFLLMSFYLIFCLTYMADVFAQQSSLVNQVSVKDNAVLNGSSVIDLRLNAWGNGEIHSLKGSWPFAWKSFTHNLEDEQDNDWRSVSVPGAWDQDANTLSNMQQSMSPKGYGTYYKQILVPDSLEKVFIYLPDMASAYELWSNNVKRGGNGSIATDKEYEQAAYLPRVYELIPQNADRQIE